MNRIKNRIMLICVALVLLTVIALQVSNWWFIRNYHQQHLQSQVATASHFLQQYLQSREANLLSSAEVITKDFGFRQAVASGDAPTISSMLHNHSQRMQADLLLITDLQGSLSPATSHACLKFMIYSPGLMAVRRLAKAGLCCLETSCFVVL